MDLQAEIDDVVARALSEDVGSGDVTAAATVRAGMRAAATITQKAPGVVYGLDAAAATFRACDPDVVLEPLVPEGLWRQHGPVLQITGNARALLAAERTALNLLQQLSGVATLTARHVEQVRGTEARILDTRKTVPGLRLLQKAAVVAGGGANHRIGLFDAVLIKENHIAMAGGVIPAVRAAQAGAPGLLIEVECEREDQVREAIEAGAHRLLLDNMTPARLGAIVRAVGARAELEASGGISLATIREYAVTGVDFISVGALTHSAPALDLSLLLEPLP